MAFTEPTILNVDDNEMCRYAVTRMLQHNHFRVREAGTGTEALRIARSEQPDLVLLDVNLPDVNGFEVCRQLKAEASTARIPVLHITASYYSPADMARGLEGGADSYLTEPVEPEVLVATIRSVLRARSAEEAARKISREWQATFDTIGDGLAVVDSEGRILRCNGSFARLLGFPTSELLGELCYELWEDLPREKQPFFRAIESRRRETLELEYDSRRLSVMLDPMFDDSGNSTGAVQIISDVTEQRQLEEQFRESQKFETIGTLAAGVAHDFNNLLTSIMGNASLVLGDLPIESNYRDKLQDVLRASQRAADLTRQLLAYSGKGRHFLQKVDLSSLVLHIQSLIEAAVPKKVTLELHLTPRLSKIDADATQVQQVILNLVSNAVEAIGEDAGVISIRTGADGRESVYLEVQDNGCGMEAETKARIFDPFFTTKFTGRGLGLAAVAGICRTHKAFIQVTSSPGEGSIFRISFPGVEEPVAPAPVEPQTKMGAITTGTILVVDDEQMVRRVAQATLEMRGFQVLVATNGLEAIEQVQRNPDISLVLLDLTMPVMGGAEAIDEILAAHPGLPVLVSTGYDHREAVARFGRKGVAGYLQKPYSSRQLAEKIRALLSTEDGLSSLD
jgi:PAS domain S-box-containing protein